QCGDRQGASPWSVEPQRRGRGQARARTGGGKEDREKAGSGQARTRAGTGGGQAGTRSREGGSSATGIHSRATPSHCSGRSTAAAAAFGQRDQPRGAGLGARGGEEGPQI